MGGGTMTGRRAVALAGVLAASVLLTSCEDGVTSPTELSGTWRLEAMRLPGGSEVAPPDPSRFTVEFEAAGQVSVQADCNGCGGEYALGDDTLVVQQLTCTLIACPAAPLDAQFLEVLDGTSEVDVEDEELTITSSRGTLRFTR
jgi:heat shock protein HslJ